MAPANSVSVPGTTAGVGRAAAAFDEFCRSQGVPAEARWRFQVALDEILSNTVRHGFRGHDGAIGLTFAFDGHAVRVVVVDGAPAFDPRQAPAPDTSSPLEARKPGGLGVRFVESLVDELSYERRDGENHLTLTWRVRTESAGADAARKTDGDR